ncbi:MAG: hypothetical protein AB1801_25510, partial [Chloroflexota bacterium]
RLFQYVIYAGIGMFGGAVGVAIAIAAAIAIQLSFFPAAAFTPNATLLTLFATVAGVGVSWLLGQGSRRLLPGASYRLAEQGLQVILVVSTLTSLLQSLLFTYGF